MHKITVKQYGDESKAYDNDTSTLGVVVLLLAVNRPLYKGGHTIVEIAKTYHHNRIQLDG